MKSKKQRLLSLASVQRALLALVLVLPMGAAHAQLDNSVMEGLLSDQLWKNIPQQNCDPLSKKCQPLGNSEPNSNQGAQAQPSGTDSLNSGSLNTGDPTASTQGIDKLVDAFPGQDREKLSKIFTQLIAAFNQKIAPTYKIPTNNMASAMAMSLAGSYSAYTNQPFPDNAVTPLFLQCQQVLKNSPQMLNMPMERKTSLYQMLVGAGMLMMLQQAEFAKHPNPKHQAELKKNGADFFRAVNLDPDRLIFTENGMQLK